MAAGLGQWSLGRATAAHTLGERRLFVYESERDGDGMWDVEAERNMSDIESSGGRYYLL